MFEKRMARHRVLAAVALAAGLGVTGLAANQAAAQGPTFQTFGLSGNVKEHTEAKGYQGKVAVICEANPSQQTDGTFPSVDNGVTSGLSKQLSCKGAYRIEGQVWKADGHRVSCTPYRLEDAKDNGMNAAMFLYLKDGGGNATCAMTVEN